MINNQDLLKLQSSMLAILKEVDRICELNGISYVLDGGTLIGAARHQGFIPWDDDLDICMLREDYDKFLVHAKQLNEDFEIVNSSTDKNYIQTFTRVCLKNTNLVQGIYKDAGFKQGIFIDVFPLDKIPEKNDDLKRQTNTFDLLVRLKSIKGKVPGRSEGVKKLMREAIRICLLPVSMRSINKKMNKIAARYSNDSGELSIGYYNFEAFDRLSRRNVQAKDYLELDKLQFCDAKFPVPANYKQVLNNFYGDYMQLPPTEEQVPTHDIIEIIFDEKYTNYSK